MRQKNIDFGKPDETFSGGGRGKMFFFLFNCNFVWDAAFNRTGKNGDFCLGDPTRLLFLHARNMTVG